MTDPVTPGVAGTASPAAGPRDTAAEHATARVPIASSGDAAGWVRDGLAGRSFDSVGDVAVLEGDRLVGVVTLEGLLAANADWPISAVMDADPPAVLADAPPEEAAWQMVEHAESSLPVVDREGRFIGFIPPQRMLRVLLTEHDEDMARIGG